MEASTARVRNATTGELWLDANTEVHACWNPTACELDAEARTFGCAEG